MELLVETGIAIPTTVRGNSTGDKRMAALLPIFNALNVVGSSVLIPHANYTIAQEERKHVVYRANKYGKTVNKEFTVAAVDGQPATPAQEAVEANGDIPAIPAIAAVPGKPAGIRVWLKAITTTDTPTVVTPAK